MYNEVTVTLRNERQLAFKNASVHFVGSFVVLKNEQGDLSALPADSVAAVDASGPTQDN